MHDTLEFTVTLLAAAVLMVVLFRRLHMPPMLGYLLVGTAIGPHGAGWIPDTAEARYLAEFGVVFLMFSIGLEFSLGRLNAMRRLVFGLGGAQVGVTIALGTLAAIALGLDWRAGLAVAGALAMSSTAIVSRLLAERRELDTLHGRQIMGVLLFQDLAVVPLLILLPALGQAEAGLATAMSLALLKAAVALSLLLYFGQRIMRRWFHVVARAASSELFMLNILLMTLGLAWLTELAGLSLALGAFLAGILISETEYRYQVEADIRPFRDVLLGLFFVTIGMLLDMAAVAREIVWVLLTLAGIVGAKLGAIFWLARRFGAASGVALRTGLALAQGGEFGFVLLAEAGLLQLADARTLQVVLSAAVLSMALAPVLIAHMERIVLRVYPDEWTARALDLHQIAVKSMGAPPHVILCGYGRTGQSLGRFLAQEKIPFIALDHNAELVSDAAAAGEQVVFGDAGRREVLVAAGLLRAKAVVLTYADVPAAMKTLGLVQALRPDMPVVVRTLDDADLEQLKAAGATEVVPEILEGSLMLASHALLLMGVPLNRVLKHIRAAREQRYALLRGFFRGEVGEAIDAGERSRTQLHSVAVQPSAAAVGRTIEELQLDALDVEVTAVRRHSIPGMAPGPVERLAPGDVLVLLGTPEALEAAELRINRD